MSGSSASPYKYRRILLKLSGEAFAPRHETAFSPPALDYLLEQLTRLHELQVRAALVVGGGNVIRGAQALPGLDRVTADQMGMLATVINGLALQSLLERQDIPAIVQSAVPTPFTAPLDRRAALRALEDHKIVIYSGGTGSPFVTTDTAAALRACELSVDILLKATKVDGVYTADPQTDPQAKRLERVSYEEFIAQELGVMDLAAVDICRRNNLPILVFNFFKPGELERALAGKPVGTLIA